MCSQDPLQVRAVTHPLGDVEEEESELESDGCSCCEHDEVSDDEDDEDEKEHAEGPNLDTCVPPLTTCCPPSHPSPDAITNPAACCTPSPPVHTVDPLSISPSSSEDPNPLSCSSCPREQRANGNKPVSIDAPARCGKDECCSSGCCDRSFDQINLSGLSDSLVKPGCCKPSSSTSNTRSLGCSATRKAPTKSRQDLCKCCVDVLLKQSSIKALASLINRVKDETSNIRRCCQALLGVCCPIKAGPGGCCEGKDDCDEHVITDKARRDSEEREAHEETVLGGDEPTSHGRKYVIEMSGLDCPDCLVKIKRGVARLDKSISVGNLDFVRGTGELTFLDDKTDPHTICRFLANVTGFGIALVSPADLNHRPPLSLPIHLSRHPSPNVTEELRVQHVEYIAAKDNRFLFKLHLDREGALKPRDLVRKLVPLDPSLLDDQIDPIRARIRRDLVSVGLRTVASLILTIPILVLVWSPLRQKHHTANQIVQLVLATGIITIAWPLYRSSFALFWYVHAADLGLLTTVSTLTAYIFSVVAVGLEFAGIHLAEPLFETVGLLVSLIYLGRTVQVYTRRMASSMLEGFSEVQPKSAQLVEGEATTKIDVRLLHYGDIVRVSEGEIIPTDGIICSGQAAVSEAVVTGESAPVPRVIGETVSPGNTIVDGSIDLVVTHLIHENSLSALKTAVQAAHSSETRFADMADRFASYLLPVASICAIASFFIWMFVHRYVREDTWGKASVAGITYLIAVLAVSCPCALALSVSSVVSMSIAVAMKEGIVFRSASAIHHASQIETFAFDKTGTLSQSVLDVVQAYDSPDLSRELAHILCHSSRHPIATAVHGYLRGLGACQYDAESDFPFEIFPGKGIQTKAFGITLRGGNARYTGTSTHPQVASLVSQGLSVFVVTFGDQLVASYALLDRPRQGAMNLLEDLDGRCKAVALVSGDNARAVSRFADAIAFPSTSIFGECTPQRKAEIVVQLQQSDADSQRRKVAFVGDGVNDSIALAAADLAISLGSATDVAISSASVVLLGDDIHRMMTATLDLADIANKHTVAALAWCGVYFVFAILLAGGAFVNFRIPPSYAGLGELVSIAPVIVIAGNVYVYRKVQLRWGK